MRTKMITRCMILVMAFFAVGLMASTNVQADVCSASGSILVAQPTPPINPIMVGDTVSYNLFIANNCLDVNTATQVPAVLQGQTLVRLACLDGNCATELPGTLTFVSCSNLNAGVASCAVDAGNSNHVIISMTAGGISIPAGGVVQIGTITTTASAPVTSDGTNGTFITRADTAASDLNTDSASCTPNVPGGAQGSTSSNFPPVPQLKVEKSCTSPTTCGDTTIPVSVTLTNTGQEPLTSVSLSDTPAVTFTCVPDLSGGLDIGASAICTGSYTGTPGSNTDTVTASATGTISGASAAIDATSIPTATCNTVPCEPRLLLTKSCTSPTTCGDTTIPVSVTLTNIGDEALTNVSLSDSPAVTFTCTPDLSGGLAIGASATCTGSYTGVIGANTDTVTASATGAVSGASAAIDATSILTATCNVTPCVSGICRTPGFWGTHAGTEKDKSQNITQDVIDACGGCLDVCGGMIDNTALNDSNSAVEAMCVSPSGTIKLQLARQLTAMSLNCCMSGDGSDCSGDSSLGGLYSACNAGCASDMNPQDITQCIQIIDCFNNGGDYQSVYTLGFCATGTCSDNGAPCSSDNLSQCTDPTTATCEPNPNSCHNQPLCSEAIALCFDANAAGADCSDSLYTTCTASPGPAGSSTECNDAIKGIGNGKNNIPNNCAVVPKPSTRDCSDKNQGKECCSTGTQDQYDVCQCHDICTTDGPLGENCDNSACISSICAVDPYCCTVGWDSICVSEVDTVCGLTNCLP